GVLNVFLIGYCNVDLTDQLTHDLRGRLPPFPEVLAVIQIARNGQAHRTCLLHGSESQCGAAFAECRRNSGDRKPVGAGEGTFRMDTIRWSKSDGPPMQIIDNLRRPLVRSHLEEINPHAPRGADDP